LSTSCIRTHASSTSVSNAHARTHAAHTPLLTRRGVGEWGGLAAAALLTVSHRASLWKYHDLILQYDGQGGAVTGPLDPTRRLALTEERQALEHSMAAIPRMQARLAFLHDLVASSAAAAAAAADGDDGADGTSAGDGSDAAPSASAPLVPLTGLSTALAL
jgi:hypothetical protein